MVLVTIWTLTALSTLFVAARIIVRFRVLQKAGLDDLLIGASLVCSSPIRWSCCCCSVAPYTHCMHVNAERKLT